MNKFVPALETELASVMANRRERQRRVEDTLDDLLEEISKEYEKALTAELRLPLGTERDRKLGEAIGYRDVMFRLKTRGAMPRDLRAVERSKQQMMEAAE